MAIIDFFDRGWSMGGDRIAYRSASQTWTYDEAGHLTHRIADRLNSTVRVRDDSIVAAQKVAVLSPNSPLAWICVLGSWRANAVWVPLNPDSPVSATVDLVERFDVDVLFYGPEMSDHVRAVRTEFGDVVSLISLADGDFQRWLEEHDHAGSQRRTAAAVPAQGDPLDSVVAISATGGTTGRPKGVMNTHRSLSTMVAHQMIALPYRADEPIVNLAAAPMTHTAGILSMQTVARGGTVVTIPRATADSIIDAVEQYGVTELFLPPTVIYRLLSVLDGRDADLSTLRYLLYGAAPMSLSKLSAGIERLGPIFVEGYGQTEAPAAISFLHADEHIVEGEVAPASRLASCGRPSPLVTVEICDPESGEILPVGRPGEVCVAGDLIMRGYYKDEEATAKAIRNGRLHTGDIGAVDEDGYIRLTDRLGDMIISGGFNIYPNPIEQVIWGHPSVEDCAVIGVPDDDWGERVTAVVELTTGSTVDVTDLATMCREQVGSLHTPKEFIVVDSLPRSANGKVTKSVLREQFGTRRPGAV